MPSASLAITEEVMPPLATTNAGSCAATICRDPALIAEADQYIERVRKSVADRVADTYGPALDYLLNVRVIGKDAAMGPLEPIATVTGHEIGLLLSVVADTQRLAIQIGHWLAPRGPLPRPGVR